MDIMYSCNEKYLEQLCVSLLSLLENNQNLRTIHIHCVEDGLPQQAKDKILSLVSRYQRSLKFYALKKVIGGLPLKGTDRHPYTIYSKLCIGSIKAEKLLYLDCDTVIAESLEQLEQLELKTDLAAGVLMPYGIKEKQKAGQDREDDYICDGVVLLNVRLWKKENIEEAAAEYIKSQNGEPPMLSEGVLNHICRKRIRVLPPQYNLMPVMVVFRGYQVKRAFGAERYYAENELEQAGKNPVVIHYLAELYQRPWYRGSDHPYKAYYRKYRSQLAWPFPMMEERFPAKTKLVRYCAQFMPAGMFFRLRKLKKDR